MSTKKVVRNNPEHFIKQLLGRPVEVKLNDNETYFRGTLTCLDGTLNTLLTNAKEVVGTEVVSEWKEVLLRGNNILYVKKNY